MPRVFSFKTDQGVTLALLYKGEAPSDRAVENLLAVSNSARASASSRGRLPGKDDKYRQSAVCRSSGGGAGGGHSGQ